MTEPASGTVTTVQESAIREDIDEPSEDQDSKDVPVDHPGVTASEVQTIVEEKKNEVYMRGLQNLEQLKGIVSPLGTDDVNGYVWKVMHNSLAYTMGQQLKNSEFEFKRDVHRFPDIYPYDFNKMPNHIGSWMGDCFGLMQWPMPGTEYNEVLRQVITKNNVGMIVALGKQEQNQRVEMISYWDTIGETKPELVKKELCEIRTVTDVPPTNHTVTIYQFPSWPDRGKPSDKHLEVFEFLFQEIKKMEDAGQRVIVHCRAGVGRSGSMRLMYKAWLGLDKLNSDGLVEAMNTQRALRMWAVQTQVQYNFIQSYIRRLEANKSVTPAQKSFQDLGGGFFDAGDFPKAAFWFYMYQRWGLNGQYNNATIAYGKLPKEYKGFNLFLESTYRSGKLSTATNWDDIKKMWDEAIESAGGTDVIDWINHKFENGTPTAHTTWDDIIKEFEEGKPHS